MAKICQQAISIERLNDLVVQYLPEECKAYCKVSSLNKGHLILVTTDSAWATQLRFYIPTLRDTLRREAKIHQLVTITIQVKCPDVLLKNNKPTLYLSTSAKESIAGASDKCDYLPLKNALKQLAR